MYVVAGVSGRTGSIVADTLLRAGKSVRVLVRDAIKAESWRARGAQVAVASLDDDQALERALAGARAAYLLSPQDPTSPDPITAGWRIAHAIARAVDGSALEHLVLLSALGAQHSEGTGIASTLHAAEERLAEARPPITFVRAACFLETWAMSLGGLAAGTLPCFMRPESPVPFVSVRDVGAVAAAALLEGPRARRDIIALAGPRDYSPREIAAVLSKLVGRPVAAEHAPLEAVVPVFTGFGASAAFAEQVRLLYQAIDEGKLGLQGGRVIRGSVEAETVLAGFLAGAPAS
jgi:NAD(P)H dehydrogenase (quinone)